MSSTRIGKCLGMVYVVAATLLPLTVRAAFNTGLNETAGEAGYQVHAESNIMNSVAYIVQSILGFLGVIFVLLTIYAGFLWMTARGNTEKVAEAKKILLDASIGLLITLSAYTISYVVISQILVPATGTL